MAGDSARPIIIVKKKKKGGHGGHHGGAWKVAYADFVTAMMAFFLLLWLLNATTEEQRTGIANYFSPTTVSDSNSGGGGMLQGQTMSKDGALTSDRAPVGINLRLPASQAPRTPGDTPPETSDQIDAEVARVREELKQREEQSFDEAETQLKQAIEATPDLKNLKDHLLVDRTPDGMRIQIVDASDQSMFELGSSKPKARTQKLLGLVAEAIADLPNEISVKGHTDSSPYKGNGDYSNWELSSDRANASRRTLVESGLPEDRITRVVGMADQDPLVEEDPKSPRNRRISIILLNQDHMAKAVRHTGSGDATQERRMGPSILRDDNAG